MPSDLQKQVEFNKLFVPEVNLQHGHEHGHVDQQRPPPIDDLNKKDNIDVKVKTEPQTTVVDIVRQRRETVKQVIINYK